MQSIQNFAFEETLIRVVDRESGPWFVGKDVCQVLGIRDHTQALEALDPDERGRCTVPTPSGEQIMIVVSEPGLYRLIFMSRKPVAREMKRWVYHDVLPTLRRTGRYEAPGDEAEPQRVGPRDIRTEPLILRLQVIREAYRIHGGEVAKVLWPKLDLPAVPPPPRTSTDEARELLRHLLDAPVAEGTTARALIALALDDDEEARLMLLSCGIRVYPDRETFVVANQHPWIGRALEGTQWLGPLAHVPILRRLPEATACGPFRVGGIQQRGTVLTSLALDEFVR